MDARGAGRRVLVAEDEFVIALEVGDVLRGAGYEVVGPAATAGEAERLAREGRPRRPSWTSPCATGPRSRPPTRSRPGASRSCS